MGFILWFFRQFGLASCICLSNNNDLRAFRLSKKKQRKSAFLAMIHCLVSKVFRPVNCHRSDLVFGSKDRLPHPKKYDVERGRRYVRGHWTVLSVAKERVRFAPLCILCSPCCASIIEPKVYSPREPLVYSSPALWTKAELSRFNALYFNAPPAMLAM